MTDKPKREWFPHFDWAGEPMWPGEFREPPEGEEGAMTDTDAEALAKALEPGEILAWHFVADTLRDGRPIPPDDEWLRHEGEIIPCASGLHASERLIDALRYAPGSTLCRVRLRGDIQHHDGDKIVGRERLIEWRIDAKPVLRAFARRVALDVEHLWNMPDVVRRYLETCDETLRDPAWDAASAAVRATARAPASAAASAAVRATARDPAWDAASVAAWVAAWYAARVAARAAAWDAAWDAASAAAWALYNYWLTEMVMEARNADGH